MSKIRQAERAGDAESKIRQAECKIRHAVSKIRQAEGAGDAGQASRMLMGDVGRLA